jgi:hypothetical protein
MKKYLTLFILLMLSSTIRAADKLQVIISAGQSNADGRAYIVEGLPSYMKATQENLNFANVTTEARTSFYSRVFDGSQEGKRFSFADVAAYYMAAATSDDVFHIKCAYGGTAIALGQTVEKLPFWNASEEYLDTARAFTGNVGNGTSLAMSLTQGFKSLAENVLAKRAEGYDVKAILWHQGESDRRAYASYYKNLGDLITYLRKEIYAVTGDEADLTLPFIMGTISKASSQYNSKINAAQLQLAEDMENVYVIDLSDAELRADKLHFNAEWTEYFGMRAFNEMVDVAGVTGEKLAITKPDGDVITQQTDVQPVSKWDFSAENWTQETKDSLASQWGSYNKGYGYRNVEKLTNATLTIGDYVLPETDGLIFNVTSVNRLGLHPSKGALCFIGSEATVTVPNVQPGQFIYVKGGTAKSGATRGIVAIEETAANLDVLAGDTLGTTTTESVYWVQDSYDSPVDATFTCGGGQSYLYEISVWNQDPRSTTRTVKKISLPYKYNAYTATRNLNFADNDTVAAYSAKMSADGDSVILTRVYDVKKGEGIILKRLMDVTSACVVVTDQAPEALADNQLYGILDDTSVSELQAKGNVYTLTDSLFCLLNTSETETIEAGTSVLLVSGTSLSSTLPLGEANTATGISALTTNPKSQSQRIYNIKGQQVYKPVKGQIYIVNGRKKVY